MLASAVGVQLSMQRLTVLVVACAVVGDAQDLLGGEVSAGSPVLREDELGRVPLRLVDVAAENSILCIFTTESP